MLMRSRPERGTILQQGAGRPTSAVERTDTALSRGPAAHCRSVGRPTEAIDEELLCLHAIWT
jgi:hypothetical protein